MNLARFLHDNGECGFMCRYCQCEDERDEAMADAEDDGNNDD